MGIKLNQTYPWVLTPNFSVLTVPVICKLVCVYPYIFKHIHTLKFQVLIIEDELLSNGSTGAKQIILFGETKEDLTISEVFTNF